MDNNFIIRAENLTKNTNVTVQGDSAASTNIQINKGNFVVCGAFGLGQVYATAPSPRSTRARDRSSYLAEPSKLSDKKIAHWHPNEHVGFVFQTFNHPRADCARKR
jgi:ABC-type lipoprotein export system ATPase subunit